MNYQRLFSPWTLGGVPLRNRLGHAAILTHFARGGKATPELLNYLGSRAAGGAGLVVMEPMALLAHAPPGNRVHAFADRHLPELVKLAEAVERHDSRLIAQVQDPGRGRHEIGRNDSAIGVSALPDELSWTVPHVLSSQAIAALLQEWSLSCKRLQRAGFSGVELSAGHGHLFHQFLSPQANHRDDQYGGDRDGRTRFVLDLIAGIRAECGAGFIIGIKLPGEDFVEGGIDLAEARSIARIIGTQSDIDYWTFAWGAHANSLWTHLPAAEGPRAPYLGKIKQLRGAAPKVVTGALGYITDPVEAEAALADGTADIVFLGRPLIADPAWGAKAQAGRERDIRYCVSCNSCWKATVEGSNIACDNNPALALPDEVDWRPGKALRRRRVVIVGAGVAGLECAWVAAARGHSVVVLGGGEEVGGKARLHAGLPGGENLSSVYDYQYLAAEREGVEFHLGQYASAQDILAREPDIVVLATGSHMPKPAFVPQEFHEAGLVQDLRSLAGTLSGASFQEEGCVVIYDQDHTEMTYAAVEQLSYRFASVVLVSPRDRIASDCSLINRQKIYKRLHERRVRLVTCSELRSMDGIEDARLTLYNLYNSEPTIVEDVACVTYAVSRRPNDQLAQALQDRVEQVFTVGDAFAPRSLMAATQQGFKLGNTL